MARWIQDEINEHDCAKPMAVEKSIRAACEPRNSQNTRRTQGLWRGMLHVDFPKITLVYDASARGGGELISEPRSQHRDSSQRHPARHSLHPECQSKRIMAEVNRNPE